MWFEKLTGIQEKSPEYVRENILVQNNELLIPSSGKKLTFGNLEIISLEQLRNTINLNETKESSLKIEEIVADVRELHCQKENENALFQVASQFNLLEMISPNISPEDGIDRYEFDYTQGPICAIACGAGTIYRNYFVDINQQKGQTEQQQIDCLQLMGNALDNKNNQLWKMKNGYALMTEKGLQYINQYLESLNETEIEKLQGKLQLGIQWNTEVTISDNKQLVSQIYCSALPVAYSTIAASKWESFARLILDAAYEATIFTAIKNLQNNQSNKVYLTLLGGGAFGNDTIWIIDAIRKSIEKFKHVPLDVKIVSYGQSNKHVHNLIKDFTK